MHPPEIDSLLGMGTIGHNHLLGAARKSFGPAGGGGAGAAGAVEAGIRLLCMAWAEFPLNVPLAAQVESLSRKSSFVSRFLGSRAIRLAGRIARVRQSGGEAAQRLFDAGRFGELDACFASLAMREGALAVAPQAVMLQSMLSRWEWLEAFVRGPVARADADLADALLPDILLASRRYGEAVSACEKLVSLFGLPVAGLRLATARAGAGDIAVAQAVLGRVLADNPAHVTALLALDGLSFPARRDVRLPGKCVVSIYSYNKSGELARTLESVLASDLGPDVGDVRVRVLVNGSEDDSLAVAETARGRFAGDMDVVALPVNVGAPAARNWLLDAARREGADWIAYLDDDVLVPADWLRGLAAGTVDFPDAGVWGCRVADALSPSLTQHADGFLLDRDDAAGQGGAVALQEPGVECLIPDFLTCRRLCASVTGCCHLFRVDTLSANNGFDLGFSPSQFDDLDSDLRLLLGGRPAAYLGDVSVTHLRPANPFMHQSESLRLLGENHRALLEARHEGHLDRLLAIQAGIVNADLAARRARLDVAG
ncbi:MAG: glycosyltransferase family 2 protein [Desulfovibrionaceae bacterium]|nr:glycosyltransferase family 2 protein [Desulfovibrionaceae bacterium]